MADHYYSNQPDVESQEELINVTLRGHELILYTDRGVFSKKGVDFGSQLLLESIQTSEQARILDVGCGYGPIGLSLAKESVDRRVMLVDVNQRALALARKNAEHNRITNVQIIESNLFDQVGQQTFDFIVSNPPIRAGKQVVHTLLEQSYRYLRVSGGELWIVIQKKQGAPSAIKKLEEVFDEVQEVTKKKGYRIIRAIKA